MRRRRPEKRTINPDPLYGDLIIAKFINNLMKDGKKSVAKKVLKEEKLVALVMALKKVSSNEKKKTRKKNY